MKPLLLILMLTACSCAPRKPTLTLIHYDPSNNRVTEDGQLVRWTNWGIGFRQGKTNWVELIRAQENP